MEKTEKPENLIIYWSRTGSFPKKGDVINMLNERYEVVSAVKQGDEVEIAISPVI